MPNSTGEACLELVPEATDFRWSCRVNGRRTDWDWKSGPPDPRQLEPYRRPSSGARSRHVPVRGFSHTVGGYLDLESGLEHDLLRLLDRDPSVAWVVAQPFALSWAEPGKRRRRRHVLDLLSVEVDGNVTVWDVKNHARAMSPKFAAVRDLTRIACGTVGWRYEVFAGLEPVHRHNLLWLHAYRHPPAWTEWRQDSVIDACSSVSTLGELMASVAHEDRAVVWHLMWTGRLIVDLTARLSLASRVTA